MELPQIQFSNIFNDTEWATGSSFLAPRPSPSQAPPSWLLLAFPPGLAIARGGSFANVVRHQSSHINQRQELENFRYSMITF